MSKRCLIIGSGPSKSCVLNMKFDIDIICCKVPYHEDAKVCVTADLNSFYKKDVLALKKGLKLIIGICPDYIFAPDAHKIYKGAEQIRKNISSLIHHRLRGKPMNPSYREFTTKEKINSLVEVKEREAWIAGTGGWAIEWAVSQGYKEIYTAGIDGTKDSERPKWKEVEMGKAYGSWADSENGTRMEEAIKQLNDKGVNVYKVSEKSLFPVPVKFPLQDG